MIWIFIDANIYLELFKTSAPVLQKHATLFAEKGDRIFVTQQLVDEVHRNKHLVAAEFIGGQLARIGLPKGKLPDVGMELSPILGALAKSVQKLKSTAEDEAEKFLGHVARSEDAVSKLLQPLFATARSPLPATVDRARSRKERGNPPGKKSDPLGDQISWEQLLEVVGQGDTVVIASNDGDYSLDFGTTSLLSPFLLSELREKIGPAGTPIVCRTLKALVEQIEKLLGTTRTKITPEESRKAAQVEQTPRRLVDVAFTGSFEPGPGGLPPAYFRPWPAALYQNQINPALLGWGQTDVLPSFDLEVQQIHSLEDPPPPQPEDPPKPTKG